MQQVRKRVRGTGVFDDTVQRALSRLPITRNREEALVVFIGRFRQIGTELQYLWLKHRMIDRRSPVSIDMKSTLSIVIFAILAISLLSCGGNSDQSDSSQTEQGLPDKIEWLDWDDGMFQLIGTPKFAMVYFDTSDCPPCHWMEDSLFSNPEIIAAIKKDFIPIKVQTARSDTVHFQGQKFAESHLRKLYMLEGYPFVLFIEAQAQQPTFGRPGRIQPEDMLQYMRYHTSKAYRVSTYEDYIRAMEREKSRKTD